VLCRLIQIQKFLSQGHPEVTSALEPIMVITMSRVVETFKSVIDEMTYGTNFKLIILVDTENGNFTQKDPNPILMNSKTD
jgi:hypothetical protein